MKLESLSPAHDREGFDRGVEPLNLYLQRTARQHAEKGISRTFVLVEEEAGTDDEAIEACQYPWSTARSDYRCHLDPRSAR